MSAALSWCPGCQQGFQAGSGLLAGLACCVGSPDVMALLLPVPWNFWHGMEDRGLLTPQVLHRGEIALWCRSVWDVNSTVQIIKTANWRGGGKGHYKSQLLFRFPLLVGLSRLGTGLSSVGDAIPVDNIWWVPPSPSGNVGSSTGNMKCQSSCCCTAFAAGPVLLRDGGFSFPKFCAFHLYQMQQSNSTSLWVEAWHVSVPVED